MAKKYIDADLLRKAVEKQIDYAKGVYPKGSIEEARASAITAVYRNILASIDSLQQEQSCDTCTNDKGCVTCKDGELWEGKEQPSEDLEAEMGRFLANVTPSFKDGSYRITRYGFRAVARHFYELGKNNK